MGAKKDTQKSAASTTGTGKKARACYEPGIFTRRLVDS
jgi:hypothetical protein